MGRSGYCEDYDGEVNPELYRHAIERAIKGQRGQHFLKTLAIEMDAMSEKKLIAGELVDEDGQCCTMGVVLKAKGIDPSPVDYGDREHVARLINIAPSLAAEIAYMNDDDFGLEAEPKPGAISGMNTETPEERWIRMRAWVEGKIHA